MLNWLCRYAPAVAALEEDGRELGSILDVGCGQHGLACIRPEQSFVGLDIEFAGPVAPTMVAFEAPPGPLPFDDAAFDTVLCLDALEHVPRPERGGFVAELARVSAGRLLLSCPSAAAQPLDDRLRRTFAAQGVPAPPWLTEHDEHGLPTEEEIAGFAHGVTGFAATAVAMGNGLLSAMIAFADMDPELSAWASQEARDRRAEWSALLAGARFGPGFRPAWLLLRAEPRPALVDARDLEATADAALRSRRGVRRIH